MLKYYLAFPEHCSLMKEKARVIAALPPKPIINCPNPTIM
jgi:hypothetical protein